MQYISVGRGLLWLSMLCGCLSGHAFLGETHSPSKITAPTVGTSIQARRLSASVTTGYTREDTVQPDGGIISEFIRTDGVVFAVTWKGPTLPDMASVLGPYLTDVQKEQAAILLKGIRSAGRLHLNTTEFVIVSQGRMRAYQGYAYLKNKVPAGLDIMAVLS